MSRASPSWWTAAECDKEERAGLGLSLFGCQQQPPIAPGCDDSVPLNHRGDYHPENNGSAGH